MKENTTNIIKNRQLELNELESATGGFLGALVREGFKWGAKKFAEGAATGAGAIAAKEVYDTYKAGSSDSSAGNNSNDNSGYQDHHDSHDYGNDANNG